MVQRENLMVEIRELFQVHPVVALMGPRQVGKTTLAQSFAGECAGKIEFFDLESAVDRRRLESPELAFSAEGVDFFVIDEIQRRPSLYEDIRVCVDRRGWNGKFLLLGSASSDLVKGVTETLAGRVGFVDVAGFTMAEMETTDPRLLWNRGGFPRSVLASSDALSFRWRENFIRTFLERDIPTLGISIPAETLRRFWTMIAHYHGQIWNGADFARSLGTSEPTARRYLDILAGAYMVRILPPWHTNTAKRQVKSPKVYIRDSGLLNALLEVEKLGDILAHPRAGAAWEGYCIEQILAANNIRNAYFWATHSGAELDLLLTHKSKRYGIECKLSDAPSITKSMLSAIETLALDHLFVVYPGEKTFSLGKNISVISLQYAQSFLTTAETAILATAPPTVVAQDRFAVTQLQPRQPENL